MIKVEFSGHAWDKAIQDATTLLSQAVSRGRIPGKLQLRALAAVILYEDPYVVPGNSFYLDIEVQSLIAKGLIFSVDAPTELYRLTWQAKKYLERVR